MFKGREGSALKFWPQKRWKKALLAALLLTMTVLGGIGGYLEYSVYRQVIAEMQVLNAEGEKSALVIYHPG